MVGVRTRQLSTGVKRGAVGRRRPGGAIVFGLLLLRTFFPEQAAWRRLGGTVRATRIVAKIPSLRVGRSPLAPPPDSSSSSSTDSSCVSRVASVGLSAYLKQEAIV